MTSTEFNVQMQRMTGTFKNVYSDERIRLIWREVGQFDVKWFARVVDGFIGYSRQAPLMEEFADKASEERERLWRIEKEQHANDAKRFMGSRFSDDDRRTLIQGLVRRISGKMIDTDWEHFQTMLKGACESSTPTACQRCHDSGSVWAKRRDSLADYVFKCPCPAGQKDSRRFPVWDSDYLKNFEVCA